MYPRVKQYVAAFIFLAVALPLWARTDKESFPFDRPAEIGSKQLKPGEYELKADEGKNELTVVQNGKVIADVPGRWVQLPKKAENSEVMLDADHIVQVEFDGRTQAFQLR